MNLKHLATSNNGTRLLICFPPENSFNDISAPENPGSESKKKENHESASFRGASQRRT